MISNTSFLKSWISVIKSIIFCFVVFFFSAESSFVKLKAIFLSKVKFDITFSHKKPKVLEAYRVIAVDASDMVQKGVVKKT